MDLGFQVCGARLCCSGPGIFHGFGLRDLRVLGHYGLGFCRFGSKYVESLLVSHRRFTF